MSSHFTNLLFHITFGTKDRQPIVPNLRARLHGYLGGVVHGVGGKPMIINGTADHVHLLVEQTPTVCVAVLVRTVKSNSSKWVHENFASHAGFARQSGYGAFTVSRSQVSAVFRYIERQEEHHQRSDFQAEFRKLLIGHGIEFDERYIWR